MNDNRFKEKAAEIKLLLTDVDGVLTDNGVYYSEAGGVVKRFSIRDGMGGERVRELCGGETGIITGERHPSVARRAKKLGSEEMDLGGKDKLGQYAEVLERAQL